MSSSSSIVAPSSLKRRGPVSVKGGKTPAKGVSHPGFLLTASGTSSTTLAAAKRAQRKAQLSVNTNLASYDVKDPFHAFNVLLRLVGSLSSRVGGCQYKFTPEEHKLSVHLLTIVEPFIGSSTPSRRTLSIIRQPTEILDAIVFHVESREDLRNLALSCHRMHSIVSPRHIQYRVIRAKVSSMSLWNHLIVNRSLAKNVRKIQVMDERSSEREIVPSGITVTDTDLESTDDEIGVRGIHAKQEKFLIGALNRTSHLTQFVWNSNHSPISVDRVWPTLLNILSLREVEINDNLVFSPLSTHEESDESDEEAPSVERRKPEQQGKVLPALKTVALRSTRHVYGSTKHPEITRVKGFLNSCPNLENLEITYTPARSHVQPHITTSSHLPVEDLLLVGRWPQLRTLSFTNLRCTSLTGIDPTSLFILAHLNLEVLHLDIARVTRNMPVFPRNALPKLKEVKACKEIVTAILECPSDEGIVRPLEVIKGVCLSRSSNTSGSGSSTSLNPNFPFLDRLKRFGSETVKRIELVEWSEMEDIKRLVESVPKLGWLDIGKRITSSPSSSTTGLGTIAHSQVVDWATLLSGLPELTTFHGIKFFYEVSLASAASASPADRSRIRKNDESASVLSWKCPKLRRVDCWDEAKVVVLFKEGRDVRWEVRRVRG